MGEQLDPVCVYFACMGIAVLETDHLLRFSVKGLGLSGRKWWL